MATDPQFAATMAVGSALANATLDTSLTAPSNVATVLSGGSSGTKIDEIVIQAVGTSVAGVVNLFIYDGSTYNLFDQVLITAVTSSATAVTFRQPRQYQNLYVKSGSSLRFTVTTSGLQSLIKVTAFGGDV